MNFLFFYFFSNYGQQINKKKKLNFLRSICNDEIKENKKKMKIFRFISLLKIKKKK